MERDDGKDVEEGVCIIGLTIMREKILMKLFSYVGIGICIDNQHDFLIASKSVRKIHIKTCDILQKLGEGKVPYVRLVINRNSNGYVNKGIWNYQSTTITIDLHFHHL